MKPLQSLDSITRQTGNRSKKPKFIIFSEGYVTEPEYFTSLRDMIRGMPSEVLADVVVMQRYMLQDGYSDPQKILELVDDYLHMLKTGEYSRELFIGKVIESMVDSDHTHDRSDNVLSSRIKDILKINGHVAEDGYIRDYQKALADVRKGLEQDCDADSLHSVNDEIDYDEEIDVICIVVDRDAGKDRTEERYTSFIQGCKDKGYLAYVTNPKFELWLLLHFDIRDNIASIKDPQKCKLTIRDLMGRFGIEGKHIDCSALIHSIPLAVEQARLLCTDLTLLEKDKGTNLGDLMVRLGVDKSISDDRCR